MKNLLIPALAVLFIPSCSSDKLDRETALKLLQEQKGYPKPVTEEIYTSDPDEAKKILDAGLDQEGVVQVKRTQSLSEAGRPLVTFTEKGKVFFITTSERDKSNNIQLVKVADEELGEVTGVKMIDGENRAEVEYTTLYKNVTPFAKLLKLQLNEKKNNKAHFVLYDDGWRISKK